MSFQLMPMPTKTFKKQQPLNVHHQVALHIKVSNKKKGIDGDVSVIDNGTQMIIGFRYTGTIQALGRAHTYRYNSFGKPVLIVEERPVLHFPLNYHQRSLKDMWGGRGAAHCNLVKAISMQVLRSLQESKCTAHLTLSHDRKTETSQPYLEN